MPPMGGVTGAMRGTNRRGIGAKAARPKNMKPVSYTHLTLPTIA